MIVDIMALIVGVMASGNEEVDEEETRLASEIGIAVAEQGFHLLTGGGLGLMKVVGQAFLNKKQNLLRANQPTGNLISVLRAKTLPELNKQRKRNWRSKQDNLLGEIVIRTHLPHSGAKGSDPLSRNHINALTSDLLVILPGGAGTLSELQLAWEYGNDIMIYLGDHGTVGGMRPERLHEKFNGEKVVVGHDKNQLRAWLRGELLL